MSQQFQIPYLRDVTTRDTIMAKVTANSIEEARKKLVRYYEEDDESCVPDDEDTLREGEIMDSTFVKVLTDDAA